MTKLLLYYEISHFADGLSGKMAYDLLKSHLLTFFGASLLRTKKYDVKSIISECAEDINKNEHGLDIANPLSIKNEEFLSIAPRGTTFRSLYQKIFFSELSNDETLCFKKLILKKLGSWVPDIIISFPIHNVYLHNIYPDALFLSTENGIFSRAPFPRTIRFEPFHYIQNFTNRFSKDIKDFDIPTEIECNVQAFRDAVVNITEAHNPFSNQLRELKRKFRKLVLLPVIWGRNIYRESVDDDEFAFLINTLKSIPSDIGVIATFHEGIGTLLNPGLIRNIKKSHPNLITASDFDKQAKLGSPSLYFFNHVDAVLNCMTGTGLLATLWPTRIIAIDKSYSRWFADSIGMDNLETQLSAPIRKRNAMIYWYLTHCVVWEKHFSDGRWLNDYFQTLRKRKKGQVIGFNFFDASYDFDEIAEYTLQFIRKSYMRAHIFGVVPSPIMQIASTIKSQLFRA